jgi:hypothetical protein
MRRAEVSSKQRLSAVKPFSVQRFALLIRLQAAEDSGRYRWPVAAAAVWVGYLFINFATQDNAYMQGLLQSFVHFAGGLFFMYYTLNFFSVLTVPSSAATYILLPAGRLEKTAAAIVFVTVVFPVFFYLLMAAGLLLWFIISLPVKFIVQNINFLAEGIFAAWYTTPVAGLRDFAVRQGAGFLGPVSGSKLLYFIFAQAVMLYAGSVFRKNTVVKFILSLFAVFLFFALAVMVIMMLVVFSNRIDFSSLHEFFVMHSPSGRGGVIFMLLSIPWFWMLSYLRVRETEV